MKETVPFWFYRKLVWSNAKKYQDKLDKLFTLQNIANLHLEGGLGGGGEGVQSDLENCAYLWKTPGYAPAYSERKIT